MKLIVLNGQTFIRIGGKTMTPPDALAHFRAQIDEAQREIDIRETEAQQVRSAWCAAVESGAPFDRNLLLQADNKADAARKLHEAAHAQLEECRTLVCATAAARAVAELDADVQRILARFEPA